MKAKTIHALKGLSAFAVIYVVAAELMGILIMVGFSVAGYEEPPSGYLSSLIQLYGFAAFALLSIFFFTVIHKKKISDMLLSIGGKTVPEMVGGLLVGALLVGIAVILLTIVGAYRFEGVMTIRWGILLVTFFAYLVQACAEEIMCRGFLQNYLQEKISLFPAILLTAVAFIVPHLPSILECKPETIIISLVNLVLVSVLFSLSMVRFQSLWVPAGIHAGWNFMLSYVCGLELSGGEGMDGILNFTASPSMNWLHGGEYGLEAGILVMIILLICDFVLLKMGKE